MRGGGTLHYFKREKEEEAPYITSKENERMKYLTLLQKRMRGGGTLHYFKRK